MWIFTSNYPKFVGGLVAKSFWLFFDFMDCSPPDSSVHRICQTWILKWVAIPFSRGSSPPRDQVLLGREDSLPLSHLGSPPCVKMEVVKSISEDSVRSESNVLKISGTKSTQQILADALYFPFLFSSLLQPLYVYRRQACW